MSRKKQKYTADVRGSLLVLFHFCLVSVLISDPSLNQMKFYKNFPLVSVLFGVF